MRLVTCPTCDKPFDSATSPALPFCSERCRNVDLGRWLNEQISLPYGEDDEPDAGSRSPDDKADDK